MNNNCPDTTTLRAYLEDTLSNAAEKLRVEQHLRDCAQCQTASEGWYRASCAHKIHDAISLLLFM